MAARLGNVIYWGCCGMCALWLGTVAYLEILGPTSPFTAKDWTFTTLASHHTYTVTAPASMMTRDELGQSVINRISDYRLRRPSDAEVEEWLAHNHSLLERTRVESLQGVLLFSLIPALVVGLFGYACRYVLRG